MEWYRGSRSLPHQQASNAQVRVVQTLVVGVTTAAAVGVLLRQETVVVAVVFTHHHRQLRRQVFIDDQLNVGRLIEQDPTTPCTAYQLALGFHQHGNHVATASAFRRCAVQILCPQLKHGVDVLNQSKAPRSFAPAGLTDRPSFQAFCTPKDAARFLPGLAGAHDAIQAGA